MTPIAEDVISLNPNSLQILRSMQAKIAYEWYQAILPLGSLLNFREESIDYFEKLTGTVIDILSRRSTQASDANAIGVNLAKLNVVDARVITATGDLWHRVATQFSEPDRDELIPKISEMLYNMAAGYFEYCQRTILSDQEQVRKALIQTIEKTTIELRIYKTQLEEILDERTQQLQVSEKNFRQITETSLEGIYQVDTAGNIIFVNKSFTKMIGYPDEELIGKPFLQLIPEENLTSSARMIQRIMEREDVQTELQLVHKDGHVLDMMISAVRIDLTHQVILTFFATDISERINAEHKLLYSEKRYRTLAETAQVLISVIDREKKIEYINSFAANYEDLKPDDMIGKLYSSFFNKKSHEKMAKLLEKSFNGETTNFVEQKLDFPSGPIWLRSSIVPLMNENGEVTSVFVVATDITEIKNTNKTLIDHKRKLEKAVKQRTARLEISQDQSRKLARQIVTTQEDERRRVSRELHDEAGQALISLKYDLDTSFNKLGLDSDSARNQLASMMALIDNTNAQIRELSHSLRPPTLDVAGINLSLEDYCMETTERTGIKIEYQGMDLPGLEDEIGISLYRILQEALANIMKHSRASEVLVKLNYQPPMVCLSISDNGRGMDISANGNGTGLLGIKERTDILGGIFSLKSQSGSGTHLQISIPWQEEISK